MLKSYQLLLVTFYFLCAVNTQAQNSDAIIGVVQNTNGQPVADAVISISKLGIQVHSERNGRFTIPSLPAGSYNVTVSHIACNSASQTLRVESKVRPTILIVLEEKTHQHEAIWVTSEKQEQANVTILSPKLMREKNASTVVDLLKSVSGVDIKNNGNEQTVSIRGSQANQVLVKLNGVVLNDPITGSVDLSTIPISIVNKIVVHKNATASGSGAMAGEVEVWTDIPNESHLVAGYGVGAFGKNNYNLGYNTKYSNVHIGLGGNYRHEKNNFPYSYETIDGHNKSEKRLNAGLKSTTLYGNLLNNLGPLRFKTHMFYNATKQGLPGKIYYLTPYANKTTQRLIVGTELVHSTKYIVHKLRYNVHINKAEFLNNPPKEAPLKYKTVPAYHTRYKVTTQNMNYNYNLPLFGFFELRNDYNLRFDDFKDSDLRDPFADKQNQTFNRTFGSLLETRFNWKPTFWLNDYQLVTALRYDHFSYYHPGKKREITHWGRKVDLKIAAQYAWSFALQFHWAEGFRVPTFADMFYEGFRVKGNKNLKPEQTLNRTVTILASLPLLGKLNFEYSHYSKDISNEIVWMLGSFSVWQPFNTHTNAIGNEWNLNWNGFKNRLRLQAHYSNLNVKNKNGEVTTHNKIIPFRPQHIAHVSLSVKPFKNMDLSWMKRWVGMRYVTPANTVKLPEYNTDDFSVGYTLKMKSIDMMLKGIVTNLFNTSYEIIDNAPNEGRAWRVAIDILYK